MSKQVGTSTVNMKTVGLAALGLLSALSLGGCAGGAAYGYGDPYGPGFYDNQVGVGFGYGYGYQDDRYDRRHRFDRERRGDRGPGRFGPKYEVQPTDQRNSVIGRNDGYHGGQRPGRPRIIIPGKGGQRMGAPD